MALPVYTAVIECEVAVRLVVVHVAWPEFRVCEPLLQEMAEVPSLNVTVPVAALGETVAVNMTESPTLDGFCEEATVVVVGVRIV